jgi:hypothetical protein
MKFPRTLIATLALGIASAHAADDKWVELASNNLGIYHARTGSLEFQTGARTGETYSTVIVRYLPKRQGSIVLRKWAVSLNDCSAGYGRLAIHDLNSGNFIDAVEWVDGAGSIASRVAELLCLAAAQEIAEQRRPATQPSSANAL